MSEVPDPEEIQEETDLSPQESEIFVRKYHEGKNIPTIAEELEVGKGTIRKALGRIKNKRSKSEKTLELFDEVED